MQGEVYIIVILAVLVLILSFLLISRIGKERQRLASIREIDFSKCRKILSDSDDEADVRSVITKTTSFLIHSFDCNKIFYFQRENDLLRIDFQSGKNKLISGASVIELSDTLVTSLRNTSFPRKLSELDPHFPKALVSQLENEKCLLVLPVFWSDSLYGIFIVGRSADKDETGLMTILSGLASALAGDETSGNQKHQQADSLKLSEIENGISQPMSSAMIDLIKHREPGKLVKKMIDTLCDQLELGKVAYLYETGDEAKPLRIVRGGLDHELSLPSCEEFRKFSSMIPTGDDNDGLIKLEKSKRTFSSEINHNEKGESWPDELLRAGMKYMVSFPPTDGRAGLFTWGESSSPAKTAQSLRQLSQAGTLLFDNAESFRRIEELSYTDNLTGLANRRYFLKRLREEIERAGRYRRSLGLIIFDLDELKQINDRYGHLAGDSVINRMGGLLRTSIRNIDVIARYGGDEFCVIMPESDAATCTRFMDRLVQKIASYRFEIEHCREPLSLTVSVGGALFPKHGEDSEGLIYAADMALLRAKEGGRNRSLLFQQLQ